MKVLCYFVKAWLAVVAPMQVALSIGQVCSEPWTDHYGVMLATGTVAFCVNCLSVISASNVLSPQKLGYLLGRNYFLPMTLILLVRIGQATPGWEIDELYEFNRPTSSYLDGWPEEARCVEFLRPEADVDNAFLTALPNILGRLVGVAVQQVGDVYALTPAWMYWAVLVGGVIGGSLRRSHHVT